MHKIIFWLRVIPLIGMMLVSDIMYILSDFLTFTVSPKLSDWATRMYDAAWEKREQIE